MKKFLPPDQVRPLKQLHFASDRLQKYIVRACAKKEIHLALDQKQKWLSAYYNSELLEGFTHPNLEIKWVNEKIGYGVFAKTSIAKGRLIGEYLGVVRQRRWWIRQTDDSYAFQYPTASWRSIYIDAECSGNITRFINHSAKPNLETMALFAGEMLHIVLISILPIDAGEQLSYDYGESYWKSRIPLNFDIDRR